MRQGSSARRRWALAPALALLGLGLTACGGAGGEGADSLAALAPPDTPLYLEATVRPEEADADAIAALSSKVAGVEDPGGLLRAALGSRLAAAGVSYSEDIEPWLGERAGLFVRSFEDPASGVMTEGAVIVETTDADAAAEFLDKAAESTPEQEDERTYDGSDYRANGEGAAAGIVGDLVVAGTEESFKAAVDASRGESLANADQFTEATGALSDGGLATAYLNADTILDATVQAGETAEREAAAARAVLGPVVRQPIAAGIRPSRGSVTLELSSAAQPGADPPSAELIERAPADSWLAAATTGAGRMVSDAITAIDSARQSSPDPSLTERFRRETGLDLREDVLAWLDEVSLHARGLDERSAQVAIDATTGDGEAAARALDAFESWAKKQPDTAVSAPLGSADAGFSTSDPDGEGFADIELRDGSIHLVIARDRAAAASPPTDLELGGNDTFNRALPALGDDVTVTAFLSFAPMLSLVRATSESGIDPTAERVLNAFDFALMGSRQDEGRLLTRLVIGLR